MGRVDLLAGVASYPRKTVLGLIAAFGVVLAAVDTASALPTALQVAQVPPSGGTGDLRRPRERPLPVPPPTFKEFELPKEPLPRAPRLPPDTGPKVIVKVFRFEGNRAIATEELERIAEAYLGRPVGIDDLEKLRYDLTLHYVDQGYINSGALLPDQDVSEGIVTYRIVEGELSDIRIEGTEGLDPDYVRDRLELGAGPPLNVNTLRDRFRILLQDPLIKQMNGEIRPGVRRGEAALDVQVERDKPYEVALAFDNHRNPNIGEFQGTLEVVARNLSGFGDSLRAVGQKTQGGEQVLVDGAIPVTRYDTALQFAVQLSRAKVVSESLKELDIKSTEQHYVVGVRQPVWRTPNHDLVLRVFLEHERTHSYLLGEGFSFSPGVDDGQTRVTALRVAQEYTFRGMEDAISARSTFSFGLNALGATNNSSEPDGQFTSWLGQAFWAHRFDDRGDSIVLRSEAQLTANNLLPIEKYELGGADTVRGYRQNFLVSDQGVFASIEGRIPLFRFTVPSTDFDHGIIFGPEDGVVTFAPFFDYGFADDRMAKSDAIYSVGAGLLFDLGSILHAQIYYGKRLTSAKTIDKDSLQDDGIQFRIVLSY